MLVIDAVFKRLGPHPVLRGASLRHDTPEVAWIRGANGCGKSTLLRCVAGVWRPDRGDVIVCGRSTVRDPRARCQLGYVPDHFGPFPDLTVAEMLALVATLKRSAGPSEEQLDRFGVAESAHQDVATLSAGQRRRAALVAGLIGDPWLLILDEPTTGLDADGLALLRDTVRDRRSAGKATLLVSHDPRFAESLEPRIYDLHDGQLVAAP
jgi:ABC-type multidrug transport system ATPase subunit